MAQLAIRGHKKRGKEVIEILEMLGGKNEDIEGTESNWVYIIDEEGFIDSDFPCYRYAIYSLEEFLEKYPYRIGDRAIHNKDIELEVVKMYWDDKFNIVRYDVQGVVDKTFTLKGLMTTHFLRYKDKTMVEEYENFVECIEKIMTEKLEQITLDIPDGYEIFGINDDNKVVLTKKHIQYPKTYKECCEVLGCKANDFFTNFSYNGCDVEISDYEDKIDDLLQNFRKLRYCRDAYWKIAGEQMGLGKPWEPDWKDYTKPKYTIHLHCDGHIFWQDVSYTEYRWLSFPTVEMRDAFYNNFKKEIEECKELL